VGEERIIPWALFLTGLGLLILVFLNGMPLLLVSGLVTGTGHGFLFPSLSVLALRGEPIGIRGKINGIYTGGIDTGLLCGSLVLGWIGNQAGFPALFVAAGGALWLGLVFFVFGVAPPLRRLKLNQ
jgi:dipeptide/tripeptide permease